MGKDDFKNIFSGGDIAKARSLKSLPIEESSVTFSDICIKDNNLSVKVTIRENGTAETIPLCGSLAASYKTQHGINSAVVQVYGTTMGYEVLLFEIFNDTENDNLLLDDVNVGNSLSNIPHIKLYLKDAEENIHLYESPMVKELASMDAFQYGKADPNKDNLWALPYVDYTVEEIPLSEEISEKLGLSADTRGLNYYSTWNSQVSRLEYDVSSEHYEYLSLLYVVYRHANVSSSNSSWIASCKVAESSSMTYYDTEQVTYGINPFRYRDISIAFACGDKSTFIKSYQEGRVVDYDGLGGGNVLAAGADITISLLQKAVPSLPSYSTFESALALISGMTSQTGTVDLGPNDTVLYNQKTVAVGEKITGFSISECTDQYGNSNVGHYYTFHADITYEVGGGNTSTVGALKVTYKLYNNVDMTSSSKSKTFELAYTVTP